MIIRMRKDYTKRPGHKPPKGYNPDKYERPAVACDVAIITFKDDRLHLLLIERRHDPYQGYWALPGGFVDMDESLEAAAGREVEEETGISRISLIPLGTFGDPERDPRTRVISAVYMALVRAHRVKPVAGDDAKEVAWFPLRRLPELAFDHDRIVAVAKERLRELALVSTRLFDLLPREFSKDRFQKLCSEVMGRRYDHDAFSESMRRIPGFVSVKSPGGRERLYRASRKDFQMGDFMFLLMGEQGR